MFNLGNKPIGPLGRAQHNAKQFVLNMERAYYFNKLVEEIEKLKPLLESENIAEKTLAIALHAELEAQLEQIMLGENYNDDKNSKRKKSLSELFEGNVF
tara:strand:+ start:1403 stop:1699 length:297 start_codon:yes stop_codon:yes gene_type:complete